MSLQITVAPTKHSTPPRGVIHGAEKIGKSTFCAGGNKPWFIPTEQGLSGIDAKMIVPMELVFDQNGQPVMEGEQQKMVPAARIKSWAAFDAALTYCEQMMHSGEYETLCIDSGDWLEKIIHDEIVVTDQYDNMSEARGGYGKAYLEAENWWRAILDRLDNINRAGIMVLIICHSKPVEFNNPLTEPYDIWELKLHTTKKGTGALELLKEWADFIGFAAKEIKTRNVDSDDKSKGNRSIVIDQRWLHLESTAGFVAGNRYGLPNKVELDMSKFLDAFNA